MDVRAGAQNANGKAIFGFALDANAEYRWAPAGTLLIEDTAIKSGSDVERDYFNRAPFVRAEMRYGWDEGFSIALETTFRNTWTGDYSKADNMPFAANSSGGLSLSSENYFLTQGVLYWRSRNFDFALGRDKVDYGGFLYGSLLPSARLPYLDNARARIKFGNFTMDWMMATIQSVESWDGIDVNPNTKDDAFVLLSPGTDLDSGPYGYEYGKYPTVILEGLNRFSWKFDNLILGVTDHAVIARRNNLFYLTDIFPMTSRHQTAINGTNNSMIFDIEWRAFESFDLAAQFGFDDINGNDFGIGDTGTPTIPAIIVGGRYLGNSYLGNFTSQIECGYTHYLWGNYSGVGIDPEGYVNPFMRMQYRFLTGNGSILLPLTSPYGPGAIWCKADGSLSLGDTGLSIGASFLYLAKNPEANLIDTQVYDNVATPTAGYIHYCELAFPFQCHYHFWFGGLAPAVQWRDGEWNFELTMLASYRLRTGERNMDRRSAWASPQDDLEKD